ncbi:uncharacterized protein K444DRAFT_530297, partial [Hyaloscypha bicolor E]
YILVDFKKYPENKNKYNIIVIFINYLNKYPIIIPFYKYINIKLKLLITNYP